MATDSPLRTEKLISLSTVRALVLEPYTLYKLLTFRISDM